MQRFLFQAGVAAATLIFIFVFFNLSANLLLLWDFTSLILVLIPATTITFGCHGFDLFTRQDLVPKVVVGTFIKAATACGILGFIFGVINTLAHLDKPEYLGPGLAVAFLSLFYAALFSMVALVFGSEGSSQAKGATTQN